MNPLLRLLKPYPFERLRALQADITPNPARSRVDVSIGEPKHPTPPFILEALAQGAQTTLANYPTTIGSPVSRSVLTRRRASTSCSEYMR